MALLQSKGMEPVCPNGTMFLQLCPPTEEWTEDMWHLHTAEWHSGVTGILSPAETPRELEGSSMACLLPRWESGGPECTGVRGGQRVDKGGGICMEIQRPNPSTGAINPLIEN